MMSPSPKTSYRVIYPTTTTIPSTTHKAPATFSPSSTVVVNSRVGGACPAAASSASRVAASSCTAAWPSQHSTAQPVRQSAAQPVLQSAAQPVRQSAAQPVQRSYETVTTVQHATAPAVSTTVPSTPAQEYRTPAQEYRVPKTPATEHRTVGVFNAVPEPSAVVQSVQPAAVASTPGKQYRAIRLSNTVTTTIASSPGVANISSTVTTIPSTPGVARIPNPEGHVQRQARRSDPGPVLREMMQEEAEIREPMSATAVVVRAAVPPSPTVEYRSTPAVEYRTTAAVEYRTSPATQYRTVTTTMTPATATRTVAAPVATTCQSPVVRRRTGNLSSSPVTTTVQTVASTVAPAVAVTPPVLVSTAMAPVPPQETVQVLAPSGDAITLNITHHGAPPPMPGEDPAVQTAVVQNTIQMLPPSPVNSLVSFYEGIISGEIEPALCSDQRWMDTCRYWEKRRVQNILRRVLEQMQTRAEMSHQTDCPLDDVEKLTAATFDDLVRWVLQANNEASPTADQEVLLGEGAFVDAMEALDIWPPELIADDKREVFVVLCLAGPDSVRRLRMDFFGSPSELRTRPGSMLPKELSKSLFVMGFKGLPFNVPDFPVPKHMLQQGPQDVTSLEVAGVIAQVFDRGCIARERLLQKDFFLTGLVSLEEIQAVLPTLFSESLVEGAVALIVKNGSRHFTNHDWQYFVWPLRVQAEVQDVLPQQEPQQQQQQQQPLPPPSPPAPEPAVNVMPSTPEVRYRNVGPTPDASPAGWPGVTASPASEGTNVTLAPPLQSPQRDNNWRSLSVDPAAASQALQGTPDTAAGGQSPDQVVTAEELAEQALHMISTDMCNECMGPYLVDALIRCCAYWTIDMPGQIYERPLSPRVLQPEPAG